MISTKSKIEAMEKAGNIEKYDGFNVVFVGAIAKTKRLETLVDAVKDLSKTIPSIMLHIIGDGTYLQTLKDYVRGEGIEERVVLASDK